MVRIENNFSKVISRRQKSPLAIREIRLFFIRVPGLKVEAFHGTVKENKLSSTYFFQTNFFKKIFQGHYHNVKQFGSRSGLTDPDLDPNCLQRLSADDKQGKN